jgi:hypothetical protein
MFLGLDVFRCSLNLACVQDITEANGSEDEMMRCERWRCGGMKTKTPPTPTFNFLRYSPGTLKGLRAVELARGRSLGHCVLRTVM